LGVFFVKQWLPQKKNHPSIFSSGPHPWTSLQARTIVAPLDFRRKIVVKNSYVVHSRTSVLGTGNVNALVRASVVLSSRT